MIKKIISGGQTGAERAALDIAVELGIPHGGRVRKGRLAGDGPLPDRYQLREMQTDSCPAQAERNVIDADGTLIICQGSLAGGAGCSRKAAMKYGRPWFQIIAHRAGVHMTSLMVTNWIYKHKIEILNVTGSRARSDPTIYSYVSMILGQTHAMLFFREEIPELFTFGQIKYDQIYDTKRPMTVDEAIEQVLAGMPLRQKVKLANLQEIRLLTICQLLRYLIETRIEDSGVNLRLLEDCKARAGKYVLDQFEAAEVMVYELWLRLRQTHRLKIIR